LFERPRFVFAAFAFLVHGPARRSALTPSPEQTESSELEPNADGAAGASRLGLTLFGIYLAFYAGFVLISAFRCDWFEILLPGGLNLAVVYGFGLIALALLLAIIYGGVKQRNA
jgi:hypothetical protein